VKAAILAVNMGKAIKAIKAARYPFDRLVTELDRLVTRN
jgi:hypothetical protein